MRLLRWIATMVVRLADRPRPARADAARGAAGSVTPAGPAADELAVLRSLLVPTRQGFRSRRWAAISLLTAAAAVALVFALLVRVYPRGVATRRSPRCWSCSSSIRSSPRARCPRGRDDHLADR